MNTLKEWLKIALKKAEHLFKVDTLYIFKGGSWMTLRFAASTVASIATMIAFGNLLPKETYGIYSYLLSLASTIGFMTLTGVGPGITRSVAQGEERVVPYAIKLQLKYNLLAVAIVGIVAIYYGARGNMLFGASLAILAISVPLAATFHSYEQVLTGRKRFDTLTLLTGLTSFGSAIGVIITLLLTNSVFVLVLVYAILSLVPNIVAHYLVTRNIPRTELDPKVKQEFRRSAFHITGAGLIGSLAQYIDKIVLFQVAGPASLAVYNFAIAGPERLKGLVKNWVSIALPRLAERSVEEIRTSFKKRVALSLFVGAVIASVYIILSPYLFKWFLPKYLDSIKFSQVYALNLIFIPVLVYIGNIFYSQNMLRAIYISSTGIQGLRILMFLIFGALWQTWGLVVAAILTQVVSALYCTLVWQGEAKRLTAK